MNKVLEEDYKSIISDAGIPWGNLDNATVFVTGATGLIGKVLVHSLLYLSKHSGPRVKVVAMARDLEKAREVFKGHMGDPALELYHGDVESPVHYPGRVDYVIHGAGITSSMLMVEKPVDVIRTTAGGTLNILGFAREKRARRVAFLSSMEIYGIPSTDEKVTESSYHYLDHLAARASYPEAKRLAETLCASFAAQYGLHASIARLTQTFGAGVEFGDGRAFADFARCVALGRNITLHTRGETKRSYLYTADAVRAVLYVLLKGEAGGAYNAANESTYCTILEMAATAAALGKDTRVRVEEGDIKAFGYAPTLKMNLCTDKLQALGWGPKYGLGEMFARMVGCWEMEGELDA